MIAHNQFSQLTVTASQRQTMIASMAKHQWSVYRQDDNGITRNGEQLILITFIRKYQ